ncbi:unnamed protein product [Sphacelaria rigidula]
MAMNDSLDMWCDINELRIPMEKYWEKFHEDTPDLEDSLEEVTPDLVRFTCSVNVDSNILEMYNAEANFRKTSLKINTSMFDTTDQLGSHMRKKTTWGDQAALNAFLKSLNFECGIIIFDEEVGGMVRFPEEWTRDKKAYICLRREQNHYNVIRLWRRTSTDNDEESLRFGLCVTRDLMVDLVRTVYGEEGAKELREIPVF